MALDVSSQRDSHSRHLISLWGFFPEGSDKERLHQFVAELEQMFSLFEYSSTRAHFMMD